MRRILGTGLGAIILITSGCGDGNGPVGPGIPGGGTSMMSAMIDGVPWSATTNTVVASGSSTPTTAGTIIVLGVNVSNGIGVSVTFSFVDGPGTFPLGVNPATNAGGWGTVTNAPGTWITPSSGAAGTLTITTRTDTRVAGTFQFTAKQSGIRGGTTTVTAGTFDVTMAGGLPPLATGTPSSMGATIDGAEWHGATIVGISGAPVVQGTSDDFSINLSPRVVVQAGNVYDIGPEVSMTVIRTGSTESWTVANGDSVGFVSVETYSTGRITGTFGGTIARNGGGAPAVVTDGAFVVSIDQVEP